MSVSAASVVNGINTASVGHARFVVVVCDGDDGAAAASAAAASGIRNGRYRIFLFIFYYIICLYAADEVFALSDDHAFAVAS